MQRLYLLRHGIAVPHGSPEFAEDDRPLTPRGEKRVREVAYGLKGLGLKIDRILASPLPRAFRTGEIVARVLGTPDALEAADALRVAETAESIAGWLPSRPEERLMLVGHNPNLSDLIARLVLGEESPTLCTLRRGGIAALVPRGDESGRMAIDWVARPRIVRRVAAR